MRLSELRAFIKDETLYPIYLITGSEPILISRILSLIENKALPEGKSDFNYSVFYLSSSTVSQIIEEAQQIPFLSSKRLIIIKELDRLSSKDQELFCGYFQNPSESAIIALVGKSIDKRTRFYKTISKQAHSIECNTPPKEDLQKWVLQKCAQKNKQLTPEALELLTSEGTSSLTQLAQELEKVLLYSAENEKIDLETIQQVFSQNKLKTIFDLWDAIISRKQDEAFTILRQLQQEVLTLPELIGLFRWQLSRLWEAKDLFNSGKISKKEVSSTLKIPFFFVDKFIAQVKEFPEKRANRAYEALLQADESLKGGTQKEKEIFDLLLYRLLQKENPEA